MIVALLLSTSLALAPAPAVAPPAAPPAAALPVSPGELQRLVRSAAEAEQAGNLDQAVADYSAALQSRPESPEITHNLGVLHYRKGDYAAAGEYFRRATELSEGSLRHRAMYNMGTSAYVQALDAVARGNQPPDAGAADPSQEDGSDPLADAEARLTEAIDHFKSTIAADPAAEDARVNGELAQKLRRMLEQLKQQQQQQNQDQQKQNEDQKQDQNQDQNQDQDKDQQEQNEQKEQDEQEQQQQDQKDQQEEDQQQQERQQQNQQDEPKQADDPKQQPQESPQQQPPQDQKQQQPQQQPSKPKPDQGKGGQAGEASGSQAPMSEEEVQKILQAVRDKERKRREELAERAKVPPRSGPRTKDW